MLEFMEAGGDPGKKAQAGGDDEERTEEQTEEEEDEEDTPSIALSCEASEDDEAQPVTGPPAPAAPPT